MLVLAVDSAPVNTPPVRDHYVDVKVYPDYRRRPWSMPSWETFGNQVQLVGDRYVTVKKTLPGGTTGTVFRPNYDLLRGGTDETFDDILAHIKAANPKLFVWNVGGYVWTHHPGGYVKYNFIEKLQSVLGEQFLGCDIGEQDGHYANGYKGLTRLTEDPFEEYLKLHFIQQRIAEDHADKASLLTVMYNWHDMLRDGAVMSAAAECQNRGGVTGTQIQYAFLRGASRQYGVTLSGDLAVFTSWKKYWTSLALRRRVLYSQYQWNTTILSCEDAYGPSPILADFNLWLQGFLKAYPRPGPVQCPVALLTDPFQGWIPSQTHLGQFKKHVQMAYTPGDFLTHLLLNTIYPNYYDNGVWKDESRAIVPTPYGDITEVVTSDCPSPVLNGYGVVIAASDLPTGGVELRDRLENYAEAGGHLVITAANARRLWPEWKISDGTKSFSAGSKVGIGNNGESVTEPLAFDVWRLDPSKIPDAVVVMSAADDTPLVLKIPRGKGSVILLASPYGLNSKPVPVVDRPYPLWRQDLDSAPEQVQPYALLEHVRKVVDATLRSQQLFSVGNSQLAHIVNRMGPNTYLVGIYNSQQTRQSFLIESKIGGIMAKEEIPLDNLAQKYPFMPEGYPGDGKSSGPADIAAGDVRFFKVTMSPSANPVKVVAHPIFKAPSKNRFVRMSTLPDLERNLLRWPTFFQHLNGVMLDWIQFRDIDPDALRFDGSRWLNRQRLGVVVDFRAAQCDGLLRLDPSATQQTKTWLKSITNKMDILDGARRLLFSASTDVEAQALAALSNDPDFKNYTFHVLPAGGCLEPQNPQKAQINCNSLFGSPRRFALPPSDQIDAPCEAGIRILDASYDDWDALYADLKQESVSMAGKPFKQDEVMGTARPVFPNLYLALRDQGSVERALTELDPVWKDFAGVKLESSLVWQMSPEACRRLGERLKKRNLNVMVDFSDHLNGWSGLTFQDLNAVMKTPAIGNHARSMRVFQNVSAKLPLLGATNALFVMSPATSLKPKDGVKESEVQASRACFDAFCKMLRDQGVTPHLWFNPYRGQSRPELLNLIKSTPGVKAALNLNADPDLTGGIAWAGDNLGMIVLGGGTFAVTARNAVKTSSRFDGLMYAPLSLRTTPLGTLPKNALLVLDGDYRTAAEIKADLAKLIKGNEFLQIEQSK
jgi:hypothetical protein